MKRDTIIIFEDNAIDRSILVELFRSEYKILEAENGKVGIELLKNNLASVAIVLLDNVMPVMDGFAVLEYLKERNIVNKIPFIMITGDSSPQLEKRGYEYGIVSYVKKPYQPEVVRQVVQNAIGWFQYKMQLELMVKKQNINIQKQNSVLRQHIKRIREYALCLGKSIMKLYP